MTAFLLVLAQGFDAVLSRDALVQPGSYRSPSGAFELFVDPTDPQGAGSATCRLSHAGQVVWEHEVPFTFFDALVRDDGSSGGCAATEGVDGAGELVFAILAPDGTVRGQ